MAVRKFTQKQIRYLWAVGFFKTSPNYHGKVSAKGTGAPTMKLDYGKDYDTVNQDLADQLAHRDKPMYIAIGSTKLQLIHKPESSMRFRVGTLDSKGEEASLSFYRDEIEEHGVKQIPQSSFEQSVPEIRPYNSQLSPLIADKERKEILDEFSRSHPNIQVDVDSPDLRGTLSDLKVKSLAEVLDRFTADQLDLFDDYKISLYVGSGKSSGFVASDLMHNVQISMYPKSGTPMGNSSVEIFRAYDMNNERIAYHESLQLPPRLQGQGIGKKMYDAHIDQAKQMGMTEVSLIANCDVGGYMWAKMGFDFDRPDTVYSELRGRVDMLEEEGRVSPLEVSRLLDAVESKASAFDLASLKVGSEKTGAKLLLGYRWRGSKTL